MFIIDWIPIIVVHAILVISAIGFGVTYLLTNVPFIKEYARPIQIIAVILLTATLYLEGGYAEQAKWEKRVTEQKLQIEQLKTASEKVTIKEVTKYVYKDRIIKQKGDTIIKEVIKYKDVIDRNCDVPNVAIMQLNSAAKGSVSESTGTSNAASNSAKDSK